jgi:hypothetical protein
VSPPGFDRHGQAHVALAGLDGHDRRPQRGGARGAGVGDVVHGDAGLPDLLLELLADARAGGHEVAGRQHTHLAHGHAAVGKRPHGGLGGEVDRVEVGVLAELGHVDSENPDVVTGHVAVPPSLCCSSGPHSPGRLEAEADRLGAR